MELDAVADVAARHAAPGEHVEAILCAEPSPATRTYLCAFSGPAGRTWLAFDANGEPLTDRNRVREAVSIAALCEVAEETAGAVGTEARIASPAYLDSLVSGDAAPFASALRQAGEAVDELAREVEAGYK